MQGTYRRRQLILRDGEGRPAGFVRLESRNGRSGAQAAVRGTDIAPRAQAVLLGADVPPCFLGVFVRSEAERNPLPHDEACYTQAAVIDGNRVLLTGGEGLSPAAILRAVRPDPPVARVKAALARVAPEMPEPAPEVPMPEKEAVMEEKSETAMPEAEPEDGWHVSSLQTPGLPERIVGVRLLRGKVCAVLHGVAGDDAPQPPPGMPGALRVGGFWVIAERRA